MPYASALRIIRICTKPENRDRRLQELKELFLARNYNEGLVDRAIEKARKVPRKYALKRADRGTNEKRPVFATKYDPRMPFISNIQSKHWRTMSNSDQYLKEVFPQPPLTAYRKQKNLKDLLIKSKVAPAPKKYPERKVAGMAKCGKPCPACPYINTQKEVKIDEKSSWKIMKKYTCETFNCIYLIECQKENCQSRYIGQTGRQFKYRLADHRGYIKNEVLDQPLGAHFNLPGHCQANMKATILEQVKYNNEAYRKEREKFLINKFNTFYSGLNKEK